MKKNTEISERISQLIDYLEVSPNFFSKKLGYERSQTIYDIKNAKSAPSFDFFYRLFSSEYSEIINPKWLFTGTGNIVLRREMVSSAENKDTNSGPCQQCELRERLLHAQDEQIRLLNERLSELQACENAKSKARCA